MPTEEAEAQKVPRYYVDGKPVDDVKLTFREERALRDVIRELHGEVLEHDENGGAHPRQAEIGDASVNELGLALNVVLTRRENEDYSLEDAYDLPIDDVVKWEAPKPEKKPRPRSGAARQKS